MGTRHAKTVYTVWAPVLGRKRTAMVLLAYIAGRMPDRDARPRVELSRETMAAALGATELTEAAAQRVKRAIRRLRVVGALSVARPAGRAGRGHYWLNLAVPTSDLGGHFEPLDVISAPAKVTPLIGESDPLSTSHTVLLTQEINLSGEERRAAAPLRAIAGGNEVTKRSTQLALWPAAVDTPAEHTQSVAPAPSTGANVIVAEWIDHCRARPPKRVIGQVAALIAEMLAEGIEPDHIRRGCAAWMNRGQHPATLPSFVNEAMNRGCGQGLDPLPAQSTTDLRVAQALAVAARFEHMGQEATG